MQPNTLLDDSKTHSDWIVGIRRELHRFPELGYQEVKTSQLIRRTLDELGIGYRYPIAETGVLAHLGDGVGPCVALRADMDALPILEQTEVPFRSTVEGRMHACGHDCHVAMLLGAAKVLKAREAEIHGTIKFLFQPAEEGGAGGLRMCKEGALEGPKVQRIFGLHVWPTLASGRIGACSGTMLASAGSLAITITGKGGHAAMPHLSADPVVAAAKVICELQTIVSRELDPLEPGVVSITTLHGGEAFNVIPPAVKLNGTIRSLTAKGMAFLEERVRAIATHVAAANRCVAHAEFFDAYPPTINDGHCWDVAQTVGRELFGESNVQELLPVMGGEDFSYYTQHIPGCFVALGMRNESQNAIYNVHHPMFKADEDVLPLGAALHAAFALRSLEELSK